MRFIDDLFLLLRNPRNHQDTLLISETCLSNEKGLFFPIKNFVIDFFDPRQDMTPILERTLENWGKSLHELAHDDEVPEEYHYKFFQHSFPEFNSLDRDTSVFLDIGCGAGYDIRNMALKNPEAQFVGVDVGEHIFKNGLRDCSVKNLKYIRANALYLPFVNESVDRLVSYGVFHHTSDPAKCLQEAYRVLKQSKTAFLYLYTDQSENSFKRWGIFIESMLMKLTTKLSLKIGRAFCWLLSPVVLILFSWPAQIIKKILPNSGLAEKFPFHWGTNLKSVVNDLQDRFGAPVNIRYNRKRLELLLRENGWSNYKIVSTSAGHYIKLTKT